MIGIALGAGFYAIAHKIVPTRSEHAPGTSIGTTATGEAFHVYKCGRDHPKSISRPEESA